MCLDRADKFGNPIDFSIYGNWKFDLSRDLTVVYRPCIPTQRTNLTKNKCLIEDINNQT